MPEGKLRRQKTKDKRQKTKDKNVYAKIFENLRFRIFRELETNF